MKAWQLSGPGAVLEKLSLNETAERPVAKDLKGQEVLVKVHSAAINPADYKSVDMGLVAKAVFKFPKTPGMDLSGEVIAVGPGVTDVLVGDHILGRTNPFKAPGALSEYIILDRDGYAKIDRSVDLDEAAGAGTAALTAYQTIKPYVKPGDKVFINGGSGGTGTFGIQIAKLLGCHVTTTCSTGKIELCKGLGADEIIDYRTTNILDALQKAGPVYSVFVDNVGAVGDLYPKSSSYLLPNAPFVSIGGGSLSHVKEVASALVLPSFLGGGKNKFVSYLTKNSHEDLSQISEWYSSGKLKSIVDSTFEFADVQAAYAKLQKGSSAGKVLVHVAPRV